MPEVEEERGNDSKKGKVRIGVEKGGESVSSEILKPFSEGKEMALCLLPTLPTNHLPPPFYMDLFIKWPGNVCKQPDPIFPDSGETALLSGKAQLQPPQEQKQKGVLGRRL